MTTYHQVSFSYAVTPDADTADPPGQFSVPFPYLARSHVTAYVNGAPVAFTWTTTNLIQIGSEDLTRNEDDECILRIQRITPVAEMLTVFSSPSSFNPTNVNAAFIQLLYIIQEAFDAALEALTLARQMAEMHREVMEALAAINAIRLELLQLKQDFENESAALLQQIDQMIEQIEAVWSNATMDISISVPYRTGRNEIVASFQFDEPWTVLENASGSRAWALSPGAETQSSIRLVHITAEGVETEFASVTFDAEASVGVFSEFEAMPFLGGETLKLVMDELADPDFRHWGVVLRTYRYPPFPEA